jgi:hypothetical protein
LITPENPDHTNATLFPGYSLADPYPYMPIISGGGVVGPGGWSEEPTSPKIYREVEHGFLYSGEFQTAGGTNISFTAPIARVTDLWGTGWFRIPTTDANRTDIVDTYGDVISRIVPLGASGNGGNYGIELLANRKWYATYDVMTYRVRIVQVP